LNLLYNKVKIFQDLKILLLEVIRCICGMCPLKMILWEMPKMKFMKFLRTTLMLLKKHLEYMMTIFLS